MKPRVILDKKQLDLTFNRLCFQLIETHNDFSDSVIIGLQPRGIFVAETLKTRLTQIIKPKKEIQLGTLDVTFYRDDFRRGEKHLSPSETQIDFLIENKKVIIVDDVLYTGRTIRSGLDALMDFGRPEIVELLVLIDRRFSRHLPIQPDYIGKTVDVISSEKVKVEWDNKGQAERVVLHNLNQ